MPEIEGVENLDDLLAKFGKRAPKPERTPPRATRGASRPTDSTGRDKAFVSFHFTDSLDHESFSYLKDRNPLTQAMIHYFLRPGDTWNKVLADGREEKKFHPDRIVVVHNHAWNETCIPAPAKMKCKEIVPKEKSDETEEKEAAGEPPIFSF